MLRRVEKTTHTEATYTLLIGDDLNTIMLPDTYAAVGGTQIDTDGFTADFALRHLDG